jgi:isopenicillin-N N-acyltransferase-like protein
MQPTVINASGDDLTIGMAHARGAMDLRPAVLDWVRTATSSHPLSDPTVREQLAEVKQAWRELTPGTLDQVRGAAEVYGIARDELLVALLATYLTSRAGAEGRWAGARGAQEEADGCTALAVSRPRPLLAKNRDNDPRFLPMQTVLRVAPIRGHRWLALSTAGAPGVHSSGMNEVGLCVADTHVPSSDVGPGVPRFSSMMHVLQECSTTAEAVEWLTSTPQMGLGTITVLDERGDTAVVECGFRHTVTAPPAAGDDRPAAGAVATNHYIQPVLASCHLTPADGTPEISTQARRSTVDAALTAEGMDRAAVVDVLSSHLDFDGTDGRVGSVCQHGPALRSETISTVVFDARDRYMDLCLGRPCSGEFTRIPV